MKTMILIAILPLSLFSGFLMPVKSPFFSCPYSIKEIVVSESYAYVLTEAHGLRIIDINNLKNPIEIVHYDNQISEFGQTSFDNVCIAGDYAYLAKNSQGLTLLDIADPLNPKFIRTYVSLSGITSVDVRDTLAFITDHWNGLRILNIANLDSITEIGSYYFNDWSYDVTLAGDYAYVVNYEGLFLIDISNPTSPRKTSHYHSQNIIEDVCIRDGLAYLAIGGDGLLILDVSNPDTIFELANIDYDYQTGPNYYSMVVKLVGNTSYLIDRYGKLYKADVSENNPNKGEK